MLLELISRYGYIAVFVFATVEGDGTLLAASFLAHRGYLQLGLVIAVGITATVLANQVYYWIGRKYGVRLATGRLRGPFERIDRVMQRHGAGVIVVSRFAIGLKVAIPTFCGAAAIAPLKFAILDFAGAVLWSLVMGLAGAGIAHFLKEALVELRRYEWYVAAALFLAGVSLLMTRELSRRRLQREARG